MRLEEAANAQKLDSERIEKEKKRERREKDREEERKKKREEEKQKKKLAEINFLGDSGTPDMLKKHKAKQQAHKAKQSEIRERERKLYNGKNEY